MRILIVSESPLPAAGGATDSLPRVIEHLAAGGDEMEVIAPSGPGARTRPSHLRSGRVRVHEVPSVAVPGRSRARLTAMGATALRRRIDAFRPDVIHLASPLLLGARAAVAATRAGVPVVAVRGADLPSRSGMPLLEGASWQLLRDVHDRATLTLAPTLAARDQMLEHGIERVDLWRRGVDTSLFSPSLRSRALRGRYARPEEKLVVHAGALRDGAQLEDLKILHDMPGVRLLILGEGPAEAALRRLMPRAHIVGPRSGADLAVHLASADLFVRPGERETSGKTLQAAMASGLPVIAPRRGGPVELVSSSRTGWLYTPGMLDELRDHAGDLLFDDAKRRAFGRAALESVRRRTWPVLTEQLRGHYLEAIAQHGRVSSPL